MYNMSGLYTSIASCYKALSNKRESKGTTGLVLLITIFHLLKHSFGLSAVERR